MTEKDVLEFYKNKIKGNKELENAISVECDFDFIDGYILQDGEDL